MTPGIILIAVAAINADQSVPYCPLNAYKPIGTVYPSAEPWEELLRREHPAVDLTAQEQDNCWKRRSFPAPEKEVKRDTGPVLFLFVSDGCSKAEAEKNLPSAPGRYPKTGCQDRADGISSEVSDYHP